MIGWLGGLNRTIERREMEKGGSTFNLGESVGSKYVLLLYSITLVLDPVVQKTRQRSLAKRKR